MTHRDFRKVLAELDGFGIIGCINRAGPKSFNGIENGEITRTARTRLTVKNHFIRKLIAI